MPFPFFIKMIKEDLKKKEIKFGTFNRSIDIDSTEILSEVGYDFIVFDAQHGIFTDSELRNLVNTCLRYDGFPIIRIADPLEGNIIHALDFGAKGIIIPGLESVEDVKKVFSYTKFFPIGNRGLNGASPCAKHGMVKVEDYMKKSNEETLSLLMVETEYMVEHIEELSKIETIDGFFIGPNDLSVSLGIPGKTKDEKVLSAIKRVAEIGNLNGKIVGGYAGDIDQAKRYISYGMTLISCGNTFKFLKNAASNILEDLKEI